jgi:thiamine kinase-like enzyme
MISKEFKAIIVKLLAENGIKGNIDYQSFSGGANNQVFRVNAGSKSFLLKIYFKHPRDSRNRLGTEFSFCEFAWRRGLRCLPRPLLCDYENNLAVYEFINGRDLGVGEITKEFILEALDFYLELNKYKHLEEACNFPLASEAYFSIEGHLRCVEGRLRKFKSIEEKSALDSQAVYFISNELWQAWRKVSAAARKETVEFGLSLDQEIDEGDRCLSPSDFGFHNAILANDGRLRFIDFEYAGWDDPAKVVCDFFCQPKRPVSLEYYDMFCEKVVSNIENTEIHCKRIALLLPVYQIKWCCIMLNDFLKEGSMRRAFSAGDIDENKRKEDQLNKSKEMLRSRKVYVKCQ